MITYVFATLVEHKSVAARRTLMNCQKANDIHYGTRLDKWKKYIRSNSIRD
jgi:hypothetical protein